MDIPLFASGDDGPVDHPSGRTNPGAESVAGPAGYAWAGWTSVQLGLLGRLLRRAPDPVDPEADEIENLLKSRRRPSKLADALTRKAYRDYHRVQTGAHVKWIPKVEAVTAALDEAEVSGKLNSSLGS